MVKPPQSPRKHKIVTEIYNATRSYLIKEGLDPKKDFEVQVSPPNRYRKNAVIIAFIMYSYILPYKFEDHFEKALNNAIKVKGYKISIIEDATPRFVAYHIILKDG